MRFCCNAVSDRDGDLSQFLPMAELNSVCDGITNIKRRRRAIKEVRDEFIERCFLEMGWFTTHYQNSLEFSHAAQKSIEKFAEGCSPPGLH